MGEFLTDTDNVQRVADLLAGSDVRYDMGPTTPDALTGWFVPSIEITLHDGSTARLPELLRTARPTVVDTTGELRIITALWNGRVDYVETAHSDSSASLLIRPDGYVAWSSDDPLSLDNALRAWFGTPLHSHHDS
jgi:hypothetical protein